MKTEVYSWRVSRETKMALEQVARRKSTPLAALLDRIAEEWLAKETSNGVAAEEKVRYAATETFGSIAGGQRRRAESARTAVRDRLRKRRGR
jgi:hypothetical protein